MEQKFKNVSNVLGILRVAMFERWRIILLQYGLSFALLRKDEAGVPSRWTTSQNT